MNTLLSREGKQSTLRPAFTLFGLLTLLTGMVYPLAVTVIAQLALSEQANGSLIRQGERVVGSALIGQSFTDPGHFWSRPSATGRVPYDGAASTGSNLGPLHPGLHEAVETRVTALRADGQAVPVDLVTASGSGLDPHISPAAARYQIARVAAARGLDARDLEQLVSAAVEEPTLGFLGAPRVNVLQLNLSLDRDHPRTSVP